MNAAFADKRIQEAMRAEIHPLITIEDHSQTWPLRAIGNEWSRRHYDGAFHLFSPAAGRPAISLVFVQTQDGNTGAANPATLGGGDTDKHLIYEGLSRVAADGVMAGASTVGRHVFFSVWHPELVALRLELGLPRHPAQIVMSNDGGFAIDSVLFNQPDVPVFVLAGPKCRDRHAAECAKRPWITMVALDADDPAAAIARLRVEYGLQRISCVGGRVTATALIDAGLVQDLYLTTASERGGEPDTPFYIGSHPPVMSTIVSKTESLAARPLRFEHFAIG